MKNMEKSTKSFIIGALVGGLAAGVVTILTTPKSGKEVRADLKKKGFEVKELGLDVKDSLQEVVEEGKNIALKLKDVAEENKDTLLDIKNDLQQSFAEWSQDTAMNTEKIQEELDEIQSSISELEKTLQPSE